MTSLASSVRNVIARLVETSAESFIANQTNLAIKGIAGIKAMSVIAGLVGDTTKASNYSVSDIIPKFSLPTERFAVDRSFLCDQVAELCHIVDRRSPHSLSA
jgi:hypothetical protein